MKIVISSTTYRHCKSKQQQGIILILALIMLIALTLGGLALFRQTTTGILIANNLTFKRSTLTVADRGIEFARNWLQTTSSASSSTLNTGSASNGYYPAWCYTQTVQTVDCKPAASTGAATSEFNPQTFDWDISHVVQVTADDGNGNDIRFVIHRLCRIAGSIGDTVTDTGSGLSIPVDCVTSNAQGSGGSQGSTSYGGANFTSTSLVYYRVTTRVLGPRNTVAYSQVLMD